MISEKDFYFPLIYLPSRYRTVFFGTVCYWKAFYQKVQRANHIQSRSLNQPIAFKVEVQFQSNIKQITLPFSVF